MPGLRAFLGMPRGGGGEVLTSPFVCLYSSFNSRFFSSKERDVGPLFLPYGESCLRETFAPAVLALILRSSIVVQGLCEALLKPCRPPFRPGDGTPDSLSPAAPTWPSPSSALCFSGRRRRLLSTPQTWCSSKGSWPSTPRRCETCFR